MLEACCWCSTLCISQFLCLLFHWTSASFPVQCGSLGSDHSVSSRQSIVKHLYRASSNDASSPFAQIQLFKWTAVAEQSSGAGLAPRPCLLIWLTSCCILGSMHATPGLVPAPAGAREHEEAEVLALTPVCQHLISFAMECFHQGHGETLLALAVTSSCSYPLLRTSSNDITFLASKEKLLSLALGHPRSPAWLIRAGRPCSFSFFPLRNYIL